MNLLLYAGALVLGTIIGSFLNVLVLRLNTGRTLGGRSSCASCGKTLSWRELIPVVSFLLQRGRCATCNSRIAWQYPIVEGITGLLFVGIVVATSPAFSLPWIVEFSYLACVVSLCVALSVYDIRHKIIPNVLVYMLIAVSAVSLFVDFQTWRLVVPSLAHLLAGFALWTPIALLWLVSSGRWIGLGDAKLVWAFGWVLGLAGGVSAMVLGFWLGALYGIGAIIINRTGLFSSRRALTMKSELPLGPFLVAGFFIVLFTNLNLFTFIL